MAEEVNEHFRRFAAVLKAALKSNADLDEAEVVRLQKWQIERLARLERRFRERLVTSQVGQRVYEHFIAYIRDTKRNILMARPYFRERQEVFSSTISSALERRDWRELAKYHVNHEFVQLVLALPHVKLPPSLPRLAAEIVEAREDLVLNNLPLVISRAKIFYSRTPKSHLSFMDLIQIGSLGLIAAVDKFVLPYSPVFCSVAIGRMVGNFIEWYSDTMLHFYPSDRRKIYRANKVLSQQPHEALDFQELAEAVNAPDKKGNNPKDPTNSDEIADLVAAASVVSADVRVPGEPDVPGSVARYEAPPEARPDVQYEQAEVKRTLHAAMAQLPLKDRKLLRLRGVEVDLTS